jgi:hypothetical protein
MDILGGMDPATAALILELQIEDSEEILASSGRKGKGREGIVSDTQLALQFYREDLERNARIIADHQMTKSLSEACRTDGHEVAISLMEEERANHDRQISVMVSDVTAQGIVEEEDLDEVLQRLDALYMCAGGEAPPLSDKLVAFDMYGSTGSSRMFETVKTMDRADTFSRGGVFFVGSFENARSFSTKMHRLPGAVCLLRIGTCSLRPRVLR